MEGTIPAALTEITQIRPTSSDKGLFVFEDYSQRTIIAIVICIVFLVGTVGNTLVIISVVLSRKLRSATNWFIVNLACADLLACLSFPFNVVAMLSRNGWPLPHWICAANSAISLICVNTSVMTLGFIAYNRWYLLTKPMAHFQRLFTTRNICFMVASTWIYPFLLVLVPAFAGLGHLGYSQEYKSCTQDTSLPNSEFYSLIAGAGAIIPVFIAIVVIYVRIYRFVSGQRKKMDHQKQLRASRTETFSLGKKSSDISSTEPRTFLSDAQSHSHSNVGTPQTTQTTRATTVDDMTASTKNPASDTTDAKPGNQSKSSCRSAHSGMSGVGLQKSLNQTPRSTVEPRVNRYHVIVTKRLSIVVLAFFICLLPFGISVGVPPSDPGIPWTGLLVTVNSCLNPLIYARTMPEFRKVMWAIILCRLRAIPEPVTCIRRRIR